MGKPIRLQRVIYWVVNSDSCLQYRLRICLLVICSGSRNLVPGTLLVTNYKAGIQQTGSCTAAHRWSNRTNSASKKVMTRKAPLTAFPGRGTSVVEEQQDCRSITVSGLYLSPREIPVQHVTQRLPASASWALCINWLATGRTQGRGPSPRPEAWWWREHAVS